MTPLVADDFLISSRSILNTPVDFYFYKIIQYFSLFSARDFLVIILLLTTLAFFVLAYYLLILADTNEFSRYCDLHFHKYYHSRTSSIVFFTAILSMVASYWSLLYFISPLFMLRFFTECFTLMTLGTHHRLLIFFIEIVYDEDFYVIREIVNFHQLCLNVSAFLISYFYTLYRNSDHRSLPPVETFAFVIVTIVESFLIIYVDDYHMMYYFCAINYLNSFGFIYSPYRKIILPCMLDIQGQYNEYVNFVAARGLATGEAAIIPNLVDQLLLPMMFRQPVPIDEDIPDDMVDWDDIDIYNGIDHPVDDILETLIHVELTLYEGDDTSENSDDDSSSDYVIAYEYLHQTSFTDDDESDCEDSDLCSIGFYQHFYGIDLLEDDEDESESHSDLDSESSDSSSSEEYSDSDSESEDSSISLNESDRDLDFDRDYESDYSMPGLDDEGFHLSTLLPLYIQCVKLSLFNLPRGESSSTRTIEAMFPDETEDVKSILESTSFLIASFSVSSCNTMRVLSFVTYSKALGVIWTGNPNFNFISKAHDIINDLMVEIPFSESSDSFMQFVAGLIPNISWTKSILTSSSFKKFFSLLVTIVVLPLCQYLAIPFDSSFIGIISEFAIKKLDYSNACDFAFTAIDWIVGIIDMSFNYLCTGSFSRKLTILNSVYDIREQIDVLIGISPYLVHSNPEPYQMALSMFENKLDQIDMDVKRLKVVCKDHAPSMSILSQYAAKATLLRVEYDKQKLATQSRDAPFVTFIYGPPGTGKTQTIEIIKALVSIVFDVPTGPEFTFVHRSGAEFMDGFTSKVEVFILDDFGHERGHAGMDDPVPDLLTMLSEMSYKPNMAALPDKGNQVFRPHNVNFTANNAETNARYYMSEPEALYRRIPLRIELSSKVEFRENEEHDQLSSRKILQYKKDHDLPLEAIIDVTNYRIERYKVVKGLRTYETLHHCYSDAEFAKCMRAIMMEEKGIKDMDAARRSKLDSGSACRVCCMPLYLCECGTSPLVAESSSISPLISLKDDSVRIDVPIKSRVVKFFLWVLFSIFSVSMCYAPSITTSACNSGLLPDYIAIYLYASYLDLQYFLKRKRLHIATLVAIVSTASIIWKIRGTMTGSKIIAEGGISSKFDDMPSGNEPESVWKVANYKMKFPNNTPAKTLSLDVLENKIQKRIAAIRVMDVIGDVQPASVIFNVCSNIYLCNYHTFFVAKKGDFLCHVFFPGVKIREIKIFLNMSMIAHLSTDLCAFRITASQMRTSIVKFIPDAILEGSYRGKVISTKDTYSVAAKPVSDVFQHNNQVIPFTGFEYVLKERHIGFCGSILIVAAESNTNFIAGFHCAGKDDKGYSLGLSRVEVQKLIDLVDGMGIINCIVGESAHSLIPRNPPHYKCITNHCDFPIHGEVLGDAPLSRNTMVSSVKPTQIADYLSWKYNITTNYGPPCLQRGYNSEGKWVDYLLGDCEARFGPKPDLEPSILAECAESLIEKLLQLPNIGEVRPVSLKTALNGAVGQTFIDPIKFQTSGGFCHPGKKIDYMDEVLADSIEEGRPIYTLKPEVLEEYEALLRAWEQRLLVQYEFNAHPKDEPRSAEKIALALTRIFCAADMLPIIATRQYTITLVRFLQMDFRYSELCVGMNCFSSAWSRLAHFMGVETENIITIDYSQYDLRMAAQLILLAFEILIRLCALSGNYSQESIQILRTLAAEMVYYVLNYNGTLIACFGSNASGQALTIIINCIVNSLIQRYAFVKVGYAIRLFNLVVKPGTYGDDGLTSVKKGYEKFNTNSIQEVMGKVGVKITNATKDIEFSDYESPSNIEFLKRKFVYNHQCMFYLCPLSLKSLHRTLTIHIPSKHLTEDQQTVDSLHNHIREMSQYGEDEFLAAIAMRDDVVNKFDLSYLPIFEYPSWLEYVSSIWSPV
jgi:hypothetical protein